MAKKNTNFEAIPYYPGTFDSEKAIEIKNAVLSSSITYVEVEGSIRAGKDVITLNAYADFLMLTPDTKHLVTHVTTNSAKETVLDANGFGIKYLIPHGYIVEDDNRAVYHFKDWQGIEKELYFYGLSNKNDHEKFRGISFGSHYANEATKQNIDGLKAARDRTAAAKWRKIIYTQNPISPTSRFYIDIEQELIATNIKISEIYSLRERYKKEYEEVKSKFAKMEKAKSVQIINDYLFEKKKTSVDFLTNNEKLNLRKLLLIGKYDIRNQRENYLFDKYHITSKHFVFKEGGDNPNHIKNGIDFRYIFMSLEDNPSVSKLRIEEIKSSYNVNSLHYKRDILGIRALMDGAIYDNLTNDNYYYENLPDGLLGNGFIRVISCDYGVKNDFVLLDCYIEMESKTLFIEREFRFKGNDPNEKRNATNELYVKFTQDFINDRENGHYTQLLYDPSAKAFANSLVSHNIKCQRAKNAVKGSRRVKKLDKENQDKKIYKENMGIGLVKDGIGLKKIRINKNNCQDLIKEAESYAFDPKKLEVGIEEPLKINDHGLDAMRYIVNTVIGNVNIWLKSKELEDLNDVKEKISKQSETECEDNRQIIKSFSNF